ncbi:MBL fold metallo-hydrolase [Pseudoalteromonas sp. Of11M-6]|uniref:ComEC/Rec2 family competence protein n=2 Tax=Pseudoalteromonas TaxID=53246 RepID=UPI001EF5FC0E|nr:MBL fold metallo-hydrolase [Pseudoalteromonas sp. Of11M-6]
MGNVNTAIALGTEIDKLINRIVINTDGPTREKYVEETISDKKNKLGNYSKQVKVYANCLNHIGKYIFDEKNYGQDEVDTYKNIHRTYDYNFEDSTKTAFDTLKAKMVALQTEFNDKPNSTIDLSPTTVHAAQAYQNLIDGIPKIPFSNWEKIGIKMNDDLDGIKRELAVIKEKTKENVNLYKGLKNGSIVPSADGPMYISFVNMGQGDCTLIRTPKGKTIMIDCGEHGTLSPGAYDQARIVNEITSNQFLNGSNKIDYLILTHRDEDHHNKLKDIFSDNKLKTVKFGTLIHSDVLIYYKTTDTWLKPKCDFFEAVQNNESDTKSSFTIGADGQVVVLQESTLTVSIVASDVGRGDSTKGKKIKVDGGDKSTDANRGSIVTLLEVGSDKILISGDATKLTEGFILKQYKDKNLLKDLTLMTAGHHGSDTSSTTDYLNKLNPKYIVISAGYKNTHGLPRKDVIDRLKGISKLTKGEAKHNVFHSDGSTESSSTTGNKIYKFTKSGTDGIKHALYVTGQHGTQNYCFNLGSNILPMGFRKI